MEVSLQKRSHKSYKRCKIEKCGVFYLTILACEILPCCSKFTKKVQDRKICGVLFLTILACEGTWEWHYFLVPSVLVPSWCVSDDHLGSRSLVPFWLGGLRLAETALWTRRDSWGHPSTQNQSHHTESLRMRTWLSRTNILVVFAVYFFFSVVYALSNDWLLFILCFDHRTPMFGSYTNR